MKITLSDIGNELQSVQVLLGADVIGKLMTGQRKVLTCGFDAMETLLGWTLSGKVPESNTSLCNSMLVTSLLVKEMDISDMWTLDSTGIQDLSEQETKDELYNASVDHFLKTAKVDEDLQWERGGIIEEVPVEELKLTSHYMPHCHVVKENSTTKIRPVFNASSKQKGHPSLNDCVEKGLNLIELIPFIMARFRLHKFGITADIRKVFLLIGLHKPDRDFLRFLWYDEQGVLKYYRHRRVVFGVSCSPFFLASTIRYHLENKLDEATQGNGRYPEGIIRQLLLSFYVDNCLLVQSKTRIAPFGKKETTIARLELLGATISARFSTEVRKKFKTDDVHFWTDSTTVLAWLKREETWGVFVQNRVQEIRKLTPVQAWRHVPGSLNPADRPSRGCSTKQLRRSKWWEDSCWLYLPSREWSTNDSEEDVNGEEIIRGKRRTIASSIVNIEVSEIWSYHFSSYSRNIRVVS
ncbi:uncharacterized protein [Parasteatoda tepidariorum]|uniref:uncharacterized protein n=1 Tax=Parasteatoda tepidariorum TaxID=114398 RepID=UPI0039BC6820